MRIFRPLFYLCVLSFLSSGCSKKSDTTPVATEVDNSKTITFIVHNSTSGEFVVSPITQDEPSLIVVFQNETKKMSSNVSFLSSNMFKALVKEDGESATLYLITGGYSAIENLAVELQKIHDESDLKNMSTVKVSKSTPPRLFYTGKVELPAQKILTSEIPLKYGVARLDINVNNAIGMKVSEVIVNKTALYSDIISPRNPVTEFTSFKVSLPQNIYPNSFTACYLYEHVTTGASVTIKGMLDGKPFAATTPLPDVLTRNTIYTIVPKITYLAILSNETKADIELFEVSLPLMSQEWNIGETSQNWPPIAMSAADEGFIPDGVTLNNEARVISVPSSGTDMVVGIKSMSDIKLECEYNHPYVRIEKSTNTSSVQCFKIIVSPTPGSSKQYSLRIKVIDSRSGTLRDIITLVVGK